MRFSSSENRSHRKAFNSFKLPYIPLGNSSIFQKHSKNKFDISFEFMSNKKRVESQGSEKKTSLMDIKKEKSISGKRVELFDSKYTGGDLSLVDFHENVKINREFIREEVSKAKAKKQLLKENSHSKVQYFEAKTENPNSCKETIFGDIKTILQSRIFNPETEPNEKVKNARLSDKKLIKTRMNKKEKDSMPIKVSKKDVQNKSYSSDKSSGLKNEENYHEWRRVEISSEKPSPRYRESTFELENQRLSEFVLKNEAMLEKYFEFKKELNKYRFKKAKTSIS